jgi:ABC-type bacteriocin/lantibiotic exporter with double-glycine peptidase domain
VRRAAVTPAGQRFFVPEVIQTSAMDCGPAALKCLLEGFGINASYGRLREACQTAVDGTSIEALEEIARTLGLDATQVMVPVDHVLLAPSRALPAVAVTQMPGGMTHFTVLWRRHGPLVQVMDPGSGRRWVRATSLLDQLFVHRLPIPAAAWREWAASDEGLGALRARLKAVGADDAHLRAIVDRALADPGWYAMGALDAATRAAESIARTGHLRRGTRAARVLEAIYDHLLRAPDDEQASLIPEVYWTVRPGPEGEDGEEQLWMRGAILVQVRGRRGDGDDDGDTEATADVDADDAETRLPPELQAALTEPPPRPGLELLRLLRGDGKLAWSALALGLVAVAVGTVFEALLFRSLLDLGRLVGGGWQGAAVLGLLLAFVLLLAVIELPVAFLLQHLGRRVENGFRIGLLGKLPRINLRYFQSRPTADMAERSHALHGLRLLPPLGGRLVRTSCALLATAAGVCWLVPGSAPILVALVAVSIGLPLAFQAALAERDLRVRSIAGSTLRFYYDSLLGLMPVRAHGAERFVRNQNDELLVEWVSAGRARQRTSIAAEAIQAVVSLALVVWLLHENLGRAPDAGWALLLVYWTLTLPALGAELGRLVRQYPQQRNVTLRLLELLDALESGDRAAAHPGQDPGPTTIPALQPPAARCGAALELSGLDVKAAGHTILRDVELAVRPGEHVAIVGPSGAGKSSLVGLLLGLHRPASGRLEVDGAPLDEIALRTLRSQTAWVDPAVQLWNRSLTMNVCYGAERSAVAALASAMDASMLYEVLRRLPDGMETRLGEAGGLVSGGEGQRVRFARALLRGGARLVILDEPFRGLDRASRHALLARAREVWRRATLLCITHDIDETRAFDRVLVVVDGQVAEDASPAELAARPGSIYAAMLAAETTLQRELWSDMDWKRLWLADGQVTRRDRDGRA